ncbi:MAG: phosphohydrolase [Caldisericales bacterium]|jgi:metal-dependent HD superfamily phosphatase/phosphodiesterase|nr:phosphohydrolase [Caldisericia bacterium]MCE5175935.1 phosphohydrolase [bacterium]
MIQLDRIENDPYIVELLKASDRQIAALGYTEHGIRHATVTCEAARKICSGLGLSQWETDVACAASFLHDIGNLTGRENHGPLGAILVSPFLVQHGLLPEELARVITAISCHDDDEKPVISTVTTAVTIIADKSDVNRSRVRPTADIKTDIHDRVNYAVLESNISAQKGKISLSLRLDPQIACTADYLEIFASRMQAMRKSAQFLGCEYELEINNVKIF